MTPYRVIRVWVLWLLFLLTLPVFSGKTQNFQVFNGHPVRLHAASAYSLKAANKAISPFRDRKVWILRSPEPLSPARRDALRKSGVVTGLYLGNQTMLATVPASASAEWLAAQGFGMVSQLDPAWIASPGLKSEITRAAAGETLRIQGMVSPGLSLAEIQQNWNPAWGEWEAAWDGSQKRISIRGNKTQIEAALQSGWLIQAEPADEELVPSDQAGLVSSRTSIVFKGNGAAPGMKGAGVTVAVGDGGMVESHADLIARQSNLTSNRVASFGDHQDHVTGIVAGAGLLRTEYQGMAPEARVVNLQTSGTISQGTMLRETMGVTLTNNSYGVPLNCSRAGNYNSTAAFIDNQLLTYPDLLHVFAAGNQGSVSCGSFPAGYQTISEGYPCAKNVLTVGSANYLDQETWFSSRGPARDGRLKPEIVVNGNDIFSTVPADNYGIKSGTSMAAPAVTGILALLTGRYRELYPGQNPESAFLKALVCNTADDLGPANADFTFGYGRINSRRSGEVLELKQFRAGTISASSVQNISLTAPAGTRGLRIMLSWTDPAASPNPFKALIQDLDLSVVAPDGQTYLPWVARVAAAAVRERDTLNNLEQVTLPVMAGQQVQVRVQAGLLPEGSQRFWLVYHWEKEELVLTSPVSGERWAGQSAVPLAWDQAGSALESLSLETSTDSANWVTAVASLSPQPGISSWTPSATGPLKIWVRLKGVSGGNIRYSAATGIWLVPRLLNFTATACILSGEFRWQTLPSATRYGLMELDEQNGIWVEKASATGGVLALSGMENTAGKWYAIQPWFGSLAGLRTAAVKVVPNSTPCPWAPDLGLAGLAGAQTGRLQTSAPLGTDIRIRIQNYGNQNVFQQPCTLHVKLGQNAAVQVPLFITLAAGEQQEMTLPQGLPAGQAGTWDLFCRLEMSGDQHLENDSLRTQLRQLANEPAGLPFVYNAEGQQAIAEARSAQMGWDIPNLDVEATLGGRVRTAAARSLEDETGSRNLILDKNRLDGKTGTSEARFTLNLSAYENQELVADFDWLPMGTLTAGNEVQVRASDQAEWIPLMRFWQQTYTTGQWQRVRGLNVSSLLAGLQPGTSFQIRFIQSGTRNGEIQPGGGYRIDNLVLSNPANDVYIGALLAPHTGCATASDEGHVQVRIQNPGGQSGPVRVGYRLPGIGVVQETAQVAGDSVDYTFATPLPAGITGPLRFTLWASADSDGYPTNDTLRNQLVYRFPTLNTLPYYEGFENGDGFWAATGKNNTWNWGTPSPNLQVLDTAANGLKIWSTSKNGVYANSQESWLQSPCFTLPDSTGDLQFSFNSRFQTEWEYDQAWLEMASGEGPWTRLGTSQDGTNWYNHEAPCWSGNRENWSGASIRIPASMLTSLSNIRFRFAFKSDISLNGEGFGIDDINIEPAFDIQNDTSFSTMGDVVETQDWIAFGNLPDKVAMVENMAELGTVTMAMKINKTATRLKNEIPYLDRNYLIVPEVQPTAPVRVRLFVTDAEIRKLQEADPFLRSFQELGIFKYDGPNQDLAIENNSYTSNNSIFIAPRDVLKVPTAGGYYLEFQVDGFSEFYVTTRDLAGDDSPLPVDILSFAGKTDALNGNVNLNWRTATERNLDRYELAWSCDGRSYEVFHRNAPQGRSGAETDYSVSHRPGVCASAVRYYRLQAFDAGKAAPVSERTIRLVLDGKSQVRVWTSPGENGDLHLEGLPQEETHVRVVDVRGVEVVPAQTLEGGDRVISTRLPAGVYRVVLEGSSGRSIHPVIRTR